MINKFTPEHSIEVGKIEILSAFSFFEVDETQANVINSAFKDAKFGNTDIVVKPVAASKSKESRGSRGRDRNRGRGGRRSERGPRKPHRGKGNSSRRR